MDVQEQDYGEVAGRPVTRYVLSNDHGTSIAILSYACLWQSFGVLEDGVRRDGVEHGRRAAGERGVGGDHAGRRHVRPQPGFDVHAATGHLRR